MLVFLHGKGANKNAYSAQMSNLAECLSTDYVSFNAPYCYAAEKDRFLWFNKFEQGTHRDAVESEYLYSLNYIKENLLKLGIPLSQIILIGHSQGGGMAAHVALELELKAAISICGDLPYNLEYKNKSKTPIYWFEGKCDTYINQERKDSYKILEKMGADVHYQRIAHCTHTKIDEAFLEIARLGIK